MWLALKQTSTLLRSGVPAHRFTGQYLSPLPQNVQNLDVGQLELKIFLRCLNVKQEKHLQNLTNTFRGSSQCFFVMKISTKFRSAKFLNWGDYRNSVPGLPASPQGMFLSTTHLQYYEAAMVQSLDPCLLLRATCKRLHRRRKAGPKGRSQPKGVRRHGYLENSEIQLQVAKEATRGARRRQGW